MSNPLVSVIIPTYNHAEFLKRSLKSVVDQTYQNLEVIVIDNHSNDNTDEVVYMFSDQRIHLFKIHNNGVIAVSRNFGITNSNGDWLAFLDSDDFWFPTKIEDCMKTIENFSCDVVTHDETMVFSANQSNSILRHGPYTKHFYQSLLLYGNRLSPSATLVRHRFLFDHNLLFNTSTDFVTVEDYDFWMNLSLANARFRFIPKILGEYVIHGDNSSSKFSLHFSNLQKLLYHHISSVQCFTSNQTQLYSRVNVRLNLLRIKHLYSKGDILQSIYLTIQLSYSSPAHLFHLMLHLCKKNITLMFAKIL